MITTNITAYVNSYALDGEIIVPSKVMTSTPQDEELNLSYTPNFQIKVNDSYGYVDANNNIYVNFTIDSYVYNAYMNVVNKNAGNITLQYVDGLSKESVPEPEPEPEE